MLYKHTDRQTDELTNGTLYALRYEEALGYRQKTASLQAWKAKRFQKRLGKWTRTWVARQPSARKVWGQRTSVYIVACLEGQPANIFFLPYAAGELSRGGTHEVATFGGSALDDSGVLGCKSRRSLRRSLGKRYHGLRRRPVWCCDLTNSSTAVAGNPCSRKYVAVVSLCALVDLVNCFGGRYMSPDLCALVDLVTTLGESRIWISVSGQKIGFSHLERGPYFLARC